MAKHAIFLFYDPTGYFIQEKKNYFQWKILAFLRKIVYFRFEKWPFRNKNLRFKVFKNCTISEMKLILK
jgi:hypothetical protein